jgi:hypothetical protein
MRSSSDSVAHTDDSAGDGSAAAVAAAAGSSSSAGPGAGVAVAGGGSSSSASTQADHAQCNASVGSAPASSLSASLASVGRPAEVLLLAPLCRMIHVDEGVGVGGDSDGSRCVALRGCVCVWCALLRRWLSLIACRCRIVLCAGACCLSRAALHRPRSDLHFDRHSAVVSVPSPTSEQWFDSWLPLPLLPSKLVAFFSRRSGRLVKTPSVGSMGSMLASSTSAGAAYGGAGATESGARAAVGGGAGPSRPGSPPLRPRSLLSVATGFSRSSPSVFDGIEGAVDTVRRVAVVRCVTVPLPSHCDASTRWRRHVPAGRSRRRPRRLSLARVVLCSRCVVGLCASVGLFPSVC